MKYIADERGLEVVGEERNEDISNNHRYWKDSRGTAWLLELQGLEKAMQALELSHHGVFGSNFVDNDTGSVQAKDLTDQHYLRDWFRLDLEVSKSRSNYSAPRVTYHFAGI